MKIINMEYMEYDTGMFIRIRAKDFIGACTQALMLRCSSLNIVGESDGITFKAMLPNNTIAAVNKFPSKAVVVQPPVSNLDEIDYLIENLHIDETPAIISSMLYLNIVKEESPMIARISITTVKALSRMNYLLSYSDLADFYFAKNKHTKIEIRIGTYGSYTICLRNIN